MKLIILFLFFISSLSAEQIIRGAFDFGSGKIKLQVAVVDTESEKIESILYTKAIVVRLSEDAGRNPEGKLSLEIQEQALAVARALQKEALKHGVEAFSGIATEAYRKAPNGVALLERYVSELKIPVRMISQYEEGKLGFLALVHEAGLDPQKVVSWDIGGGSCQIAYFDDQGEFKVYMLPFGRSTTKNALIRDVKGQNPTLANSPNPMSRKDWDASIDYLLTEFPEVPAELVNKLKQADVKFVGIGAHPKALRKLKSYGINEIEQCLIKRLDKTDAEMKHDTPALAVSELALVYSIFQKLQINTVNYYRTKSGSTTGLLLSNEYW